MRTPVASTHAHSKSTRSLAGLAVALVAIPGFLRASEDIAPLLEKIRTKRDIPALAAAAYQDGKLVAIGATGLRRKGGTEQVTKDDLWHLGSCTKSMTSLVAARLVDRGILRWEQAVGDTLNPRIPKMDAAWKPATLEQLLGNRGGAPHKAPGALWQEAWKRKGTPSDQRWTFTRGLLAAAPENPPGTKFVYSNQGYTIAGQMMEIATGKAWEDLVRQELFQPLQLTSGGFGAPGDAKKVDQPWGHADGKPVPPGPDADNPASIGPGGIVHMSIGDFAKYAAWHIKGSDALSAAQFQRLHTPLAGQEYALGWFVTRRPWGGDGPVLTHNGTNTMNFAVMWVAPSRGLAVVAASNAGGSAAEKGCDDACSQLIQRLLPKQ